MTAILLFARRAIIQSVTFWVTPFEFVFDVIEAELHRRGVDLSNGCIGQQQLERPPHASVGPVHRQLLAARPNNHAG